MGIIIKYCDKLNSEKRSFKDMEFRDAILIGCAQVFALIPGFSRSGTTISMARVLKINRSDAAKFSFYLSAPVVLGAVAIKVLKGEKGIVLNEIMNVQNYLMYWLKQGENI